MTLTDSSNRLNRLREVEPVGHGVFELARAEAEDEAALRKVIKGQRCLREHGWVSADRVDDGRHDGCRRREDGGRGSDGHTVEVPVRDGDAVARSVNSGAHIESGQKLNHVVR